MTFGGGARVALGSGKTKRRRTGSRSTEGPNKRRRRWPGAPLTQAAGAALAAAVADRGNDRACWRRAGALLDRQQHAQQLSAHQRSLRVHTGGPAAAGAAGSAW